MAISKITYGVVFRVVQTYVSRRGYELKKGTEDYPYLLILPISPHVFAIRYFLDLNDLIDAVKDLDLVTDYYLMYEFLSTGL